MSKLSFEEFEYFRARTVTGQKDLKIPPFSAGKTLRQILSNPNADKD
jgi:hypothetical protein